MQEFETVGPWTLLERIGDGGNAVVWRATRAEMTSPVALKIINSTNADREPYKRFVQEVEFLRSIGDERGVLPLLDAHLPSNPTRNDRAWLAMPIALPIEKALEDQPLETVVMAVGAIAATMARLAERSVGHRDIKPGNLYALNGEWLVGDFGLVAAPDLSEMTRDGKAIGPAHFTAYELIRDPANADPLPADVYSLGKTLWVLATKQRWPPEGHQPAATRGYSIAALRPHAHADALDRLVDRATRLHPEERPTMAEVAKDLDAWRDLGQSPTDLDVSEIGRKFRLKIERELAAEDLLEQRREMALAAARKVQELARPLNEALRKVHPRAETDRIPDAFAENMLFAIHVPYGHISVFKFGRMSRLSSGSGPLPLDILSGYGIELTADGLITFRAFVHVGLRQVMDTKSHWSSPPHQASVGSVAMDRILELGMSELASGLHHGLEVFVSNTPSA